MKDLQLYILLAMEDCVFCQIIAKKISAEFVLETDNFVVFRDTKPETKVHLLIVSRKHIADIERVGAAYWNQIREVAKQLKAKLNLSGYQLLTNCGDLQEVKHLHFHFKSY